MPGPSFPGYSELRLGMFPHNDSGPCHDAQPPLLSSAPFSPTEPFSYQHAAIAHLKHCTLHNDEALKICSGRNKRGGVCLNRASGTRVAHLMPTCKKHREQPRLATPCREVLPCGFECGAVFQYKPHDFRLCYRHQSHQSCYFLELPTEVRMNIYDFLIPGSFVPARFVRHGPSLNDPRDSKVFQGVSMAILRVNSMIHDEVARQLYGRKTFEIQISRNVLTMCNGARLQAIRMPGLSSSTTANHALQDYQMQLMLLERQNKKRLMMARQEQDNASTGLNMGYAAAATTRSQPPLKVPIPFVYDINGPSWTQPIAERYFNMIRSFRISLDIPGPTPSFGQPSVIQSSHLGFGSVSADTLKSRKVIVYELTDHVHRLIGRLQQLPTENLRLEIDMAFQDIYTEISDAHSDVRLLLAPFTRIGKCASFKAERVIMGNSSTSTNPPIELYPRKSGPAANGQYDCLIDFMRRWPKEVSQIEPSLEMMKIWKDYWRLEKLVTGINSQCPNTIIFDQFTGLCQEARMAREAVDSELFEKVRKAVVHIWAEYTRSQKAFQDGVESEIEGLCGGGVDVELFGSASTW